MQGMKLATCLMTPPRIMRVLVRHRGQHGNEVSPDHAGMYFSNQVTSLVR